MRLVRGKVYEQHALLCSVQSVKVQRITRISCIPH
jgi:hypothetical protein